MSLEAVQVLTKEYHNLNCSPSGVRCSFVKINDQWGIKTYKDEFKRDECFENQSLAYDYGFAPEVGHTFEFEAGDETLYCYVTEIAQTLYPKEELELQALKQMFIEENPDNYWDKDFYNELKEDLYNIRRPIHAKYFSQMSELMENIREATGLDLDDCHGGNFGFIGDKLVCIDFGVNDAC